MNKLLIIGAGGHGKVVADAAQAMKNWEHIAFIDRRYAAGERQCLGFPIIGDDSILKQCLADFSHLIVAIGDNSLRYQLQQRGQSLGFTIATIIHPTSTVSSRAKIGCGTVILANAVINADAQIGAAGIINTAAVIEHDCKLEQGVHISPNASLAGNVSVGEYSWIGIGATVIQNIPIGQRVIVGAGSVVITPIPDHATVAGVPAKFIKEPLYEN